jgi:hypothetical protein
MQWEYPLILWGLVAVPLLVVLFSLLWRQKKAFWEAWCKLPFTRKQSVFPSRGKYFLKESLFLLGFLFSVIGFASPGIQRSAWEPFWENVALIMLVDFSKSMEAPRDPQDEHSLSRFVETKKGIQEFISSLPKGVKVSFVPFSEYAVPITSGFSDDYGELTAKIRRLERDFFYKQGTDLTIALREGFNLADTFLQVRKIVVEPSAPTASPVTSIILISDGDTRLTPEIGNFLAKRGNTMPIFTVGVGSEFPTYIPDSLSPVGYLVDKKGVPVTTSFKAETLQFIAEKTGGAYYTFENRGELFAALRDIIQKQGNRSQREYTYLYPLRSFFFLGAFVFLLVFWKLDD